MATLKWLLIVSAMGYAGFLTLIYLGQRAMMYFPERARTSPASVGLAQAEETVLETADGEKVIAWHVPARGERLVVIYFHGNGGALAHRAGRFAALVADGTGLLALSYRGYGGSTGRPSEAGLIRDGDAAYRFGAARYAAERLVLWGESLGTGVAVALAAERPVGGMILEAPFASAADLGAMAYPFLPVRLLMKDQFRSDEKIGAVCAPVLVLHGGRDHVVPIAQGERLFALVRGRKKFVRFADGGHNDLDVHGALDAARAFLADEVARADPARDRSVN
jgi:fermentation-respiration switch protein FrsA (DUF1100 family)